MTRFVQKPNRIFSIYVRPVHQESDRWSRIYQKKINVINTEKSGRGGSSEPPCFLGFESDHVNLLVEDRQYEFLVLFNPITLTIRLTASENVEKHHHSHRPTEKAKFRFGKIVNACHLFVFNSYKIDLRIEGQTSSKAETMNCIASHLLIYYCFINARHHKSNMWPLPKITFTLYHLLSSSVLSIQTSPTPHVI